MWVPIRTIEVRELPMVRGAAVTDGAGMTLTGALLSQARPELKGEVPRWDRLYLMLSMTKY